MLTESCKKLQPKFICSQCDYITFRKSSYTKHISTLKHKMLTNANEKLQKVAPTYGCSDCGKLFKHKPSLCRHRKTCQESNKIQIEKEKLEEITVKAELYEQHHNELKSLVEKTANTGSTTINNNLNINIVLNTKCKDAMNITDFVDTLKLSLEDLIYTGNYGYIEGVSNIFIKGLQDMDPEQRPIHCADKRGNSLYIKDDDKWEKDGDSKVLNTQIGAVTKKHIDILKAWEEAHPNWKSSDNETKTYIELVQKITGGSSEEERIKNCRLIQRKIGKNFNIGDVSEK